MPRSRTWINIGIFALLAGLGRTMLGAPAQPDVVWNRWEVIGAFLIFLAFVQALVAWGAIIRQGLIVSESCLEWELLLGSAGLALLVPVLGLFGFLRAEFSLLAWGVLVVGVALAPSVTIEPWERFRSQLNRWGRWERLALGLLVVLVAIRFLQGFKLASHGDPFHYELAAPRHWFNVGRLEVPSTHPFHGQAGAWNFLYVWVALLVGGRNSTGLVAGQHLSQWAHTLGWAGTGALIFGLLRQSSLSRGWVALAVLSALSTPELRAFAGYAKCDWGSIFWVLGGLVLLLQVRTTVVRASSRLLVLAGLLFGLGFSAKFSTGYFLAAVFLWAILKFRRGIFWVIIGGIIGGAPVWIRNFYFTGNPVFPALHRLFETRGLGPTMDAAHSTLYLEAGWGTHLISSATGLQNWILSDVRVGLAALAVGVVWVGDRRRRQKVLQGGSDWPVPMTIGTLALLGALLFFLHLGDRGMLRWLGPAWVLSSIPLFQVLNTVEQRLKDRGAKGAVVALAGVFIVGLADLPVFSLLQVWTDKYESGGTGLLHSTGQGAEKSWIRKNLPWGSRLLVLGDNELYYLDPFDAVVHYEEAEMDLRLTTLSSDSELLELLREKHFDYVVEFLRGPQHVRNQIPHHLLGFFDGLVERGLERIQTPAGLKVWRISR